MQTVKDSTLTMPPSPDRKHNISSPSETLTPSELEQLRRVAKEQSDSALKAFSQLPKVKPKA